LTVQEYFGYFKDLSGAYNGFSELYELLNNKDSSIYYANKALILSKNGKFNKELLGVYLELANFYETRSKKIAYK